MFKKLDPLLHSELRLAVMSVLVNLEEADFVYLREATGATAGNLSVQIDKLTAAQYITVEKAISGPSDVIATLIISRPKYSAIAKCLSYPGTTAINFLFLL